MSRGHPPDVFANKRYYDNESEMDHDRRETLPSDAGAPGERYYDHPGAYDAYGKRVVSLPYIPSHPTSAQKRDADTDSEADAYGPRYPPSAEYLPSRMHSDDYAAPTVTEFHSGPVREPYAAWTAERQIPLSKE